MYWIIQWLNVDDRVVQQWQQDMCIVADRGLQGVFGLCTGDYKGRRGGARENAGRWQRNTEDVHTDRGFQSQYC